MGNNGDPRFRISEKHQEEEKKMRMNNGEIQEKMNFEGLFRHTAYGVLKGMTMEKCRDVWKTGY